MLTPTVLFVAVLFIYWGDTNFTTPCSLGHVLLKEFGITAVPEIKQIPVTANGPFALVLCSDGVTDELLPDEIASSVGSSSDLAKVCTTKTKAMFICTCVRVCVCVFGLPFFGSLVAFT